MLVQGELGWRSWIYSKCFISDFTRGRCSSNFQMEEYCLWRQIVTVESLEEERLSSILYSVKRDHHVWTYHYDMFQVCWKLMRRETTRLLDCFSRNCFSMFKSMQNSM